MAIRSDSVTQDNLSKATFPTEWFERDRNAGVLYLKDDYELVVSGTATLPATTALPPVGSVIMFGGASAPTGWLLCDNSAVSRTTYAGLFAVIGTTYGVGDGATTFNLPDMRGVFPRGAGTSAKLTNANGVAFAGTLGTYQNDKMQGHRHYAGIGRSTNNLPHVYGTDTTDVPGLATARYDAFVVAVDRQPITSIPKSDTVNGTPRTGDETNPANLALNFIIKY